MAPIDAGELLKLATAALGGMPAGDLGDPDWQQRFESLVADLDGSPMHLLGRLMTKQELLRSLRTRMLLTAAIDATPQITAEPVRAPVMIAGPARSGTSILFELLGLHPDLRAPIGAEALHPVPLPEVGLAELLEALRDADERWVSPEWNLHTADDVVEAHRALLHYLQWGLVGLFERDLSAPRFQRLVTPSRKLLGDNPDTVYFEAPVSAGHQDRVTGETKGATYLSITVESSTGWGSMDNQVLSVLNDSTLDVDADGRFDIIVGGEPRQGNWMELPPSDGAIISRHYFEDTTHAATDPARFPAMDIEVIDGTPPPPPSDDSVSVGIRRIAAMIRELTVDRVPMAQGEPRS